MNFQLNYRSVRGSFFWTFLVVFTLGLAGLFSHKALAQDAAPKDTATAAPADATATAAPAGALSADAAVIASGKEVFDANCKQCHAVHEKVVGPALKDVSVRRTVPWLINFIKYPEKVIKSGDPYAVALYNEYKQIMPNHDFLKDEQIVAILSYVQDETKKGPAVAVAAGAGAGTTTEESGGSSGLLVLTICILATLLLLAGFALAILGRSFSLSMKQNRNFNEAEKEFLDENPFEIGAVIKSRPFLGVCTLIFIALIAKTVVEGLFTVGIQQGYAPDQPIPFSHKLHAGQYKIDCKYCHGTAARGKSAGIPAANLCMNCHNKIKTGSPEIQKIYAAIEKNEPIQWVRIHNLPDLAYFNHSQHVTVAGIECQRCHGNIEEMEIVQQSSLLTMGWCIACHRETEVNTKDNPYYEDMVKLHAKNAKKPLKVEDIGGLECAKCHY
ncbi:MAG: cytochrome C [Cytophagales bacterium]|nr:MAG: cytochrome C [Cytophagales bacterium]TAF60526.1 MAG: cytochrome C [Cytophagales bacterium]